MLRLLIFALLLAPSFLASSFNDQNTWAGPAPKNKIPVVLMELEEKYAAASTLAAEFTQINESALTRQKKTSSGTLMVKRPNKMRWETIKPDPNILVSNGIKFWFYTPPFDEGERGQVIEKKTSEVSSRLANALLAGAFSSTTKTMEIQKRGPGLFRLFPRPGSAGTVIRAEVELDLAKKLISKVTLHHRDGNSSEIMLTKIELGKPLGDELFYFVPPPNTDRVNP
jgi:outer membrane lipoprotein carrier protein